MNSIKTVCVISVLGLFYDCDWYNHIEILYNCTYLVDIMGVLR